MHIRNLALYAIFAMLLPFLSMQAGENKQVESLKNRMISDLDIIKNAFEVRYAPAEWKKTHSGWDLDDQINKAKNQVLGKENITLKDYHRIVKEFFRSTQDYHVGIQFLSTEMSILPIEIESAGGRYFIKNVNYNMLPMNAFGLKKGDEILLFDGQPVEEAVQTLIANEFGKKGSQTDHALGVIALTTRLGLKGDIVPKGETEMVIQDSMGKTSTYMLSWFHLPEKIIPLKEKALPKKYVYSQGDSLAKNPFFHKQMVFPFYKPYHEAFLKANPEAHEKPMGGKRSSLPNLGQVIWEAPEDWDFQGYLYKTTQGKVVGFLRMPSYALDVEHEENAMKTIADLASLIEIFEAKADALVIDQQNNPGGYLFFMYAFASMLTDKPLVVPMERLTITQADVMQAIALIDMLPFMEMYGFEKNEPEVIMGFRLENMFVDCLVEHAKFVIQEWGEGRNFTNPTFFYGVERILPNPEAHFSKPILILVNSLDFSCADFLPAIMQDNKRAAIMGTKTAGAGGYVMQDRHENLLGIGEYSYTGSIAQRIDLNPIEDLGVTPEIAYEVTPEDLQHGYKGYIHAINMQIERMLK